MISFYPGPSRIHDEIPGYVRDAAKLGIMSINHRSRAFVKIYSHTEKLLKRKLRIPTNYTVIFTSSATECWEVIAQSLNVDESLHIFNGAFGKKWFEYTRRIRPNTVSLEFDREDVIQLSSIETKGGVICLTQNETSNGTQVSNDIIQRVRTKFPSHLIAIDATSSMGGILLDFAQADIWFASVQKCFGLPAGMGVIALSPLAVKRAMEINERNHYNSLPFMLEMATKHQTSYTPNVINIYLLMRTLEVSPPIKALHKSLHERYDTWIKFLAQRKYLKHLVQNQQARSYTVIPVDATLSIITKVKKECAREGILLGEGYGDLRQSTFRIANFPAIKSGEIKSLMKILSKY